MSLCPSPRPYPISAGFGFSEGRPLFSRGHAFVDHMISGVCIHLPPNPLWVADNLLTPFGQQTHTIPGEVFGDHIFRTPAMEEEEKRLVLC